MKLMKLVIALGLAVASFGKVAAQQPCDSTPACNEVCTNVAGTIRWVAPNTPPPSASFEVDSTDPENPKFRGYWYDWLVEIGRRTGRELEFVGFRESAASQFEAVCSGEADMSLAGFAISESRLKAVSFLEYSQYTANVVRLLVVNPELLNGATPETAVSVYRQNFIKAYGREPIFLSFGGPGSRYDETLVAAGVPRDKIIDVSNTDILTPEDEAAAFIQDPTLYPNQPAGQLYDADFSNADVDNYPATIPLACRVSFADQVAAAYFNLTGTQLGDTPNFFLPRFFQLGGGFAVNSNCCELLLQMQCALDTMLADGTFAAAFNANISRPEIVATLPLPLDCYLLPNSRSILPPALHESVDKGFFPRCESTLDCGVPALRVGTCVGDKPWEFLQNGRLVGFDVDVAAAIAKVLGRELAITNYPKSWLVPGLLNNAIDLAISHIAIDDALLSEVAAVQYNGNALTEGSELVGIGINSECCQLYADVKAAVLKLEANGTLPALRKKWKVPTSFFFKDFTPDNCKYVVPNLNEGDCLQQALAARNTCTGTLFQFNLNPGVAGLCA